MMHDANSVTQTCAGNSGKVIAPLVLPSLGLLNSWFVGKGLVLLEIQHLG